VPRTVLVLDQLPLNPNGKILKKELAGPLTQAAAQRARMA